MRERIAPGVKEGDVRVGVSNDRVFQQVEDGFQVLHVVYRYLEGQVLLFLDLRLLVLKQGEFFVGEHLVELVASIRTPHAPLEVAGDVLLVLFEISIVVEEVDTVARVFEANVFEREFSSVVLLVKLAVDAEFVLRNRAGLVNHVHLHETASLVRLETRLFHRKLSVDAQRIQGKLLHLDGLLVGLHVPRLGLRMHVDFSHTNNSASPLSTLLSLQAHVLRLLGVVGAKFFLNVLQIIL